MKKLIPMTEFVLEQTEILIKGCEGHKPTAYNYYIRSTSNYAKLLSQKLEIWMFVPCDLEGNVLKKPDADFYMMVTDKDLKEYQEAKERCLFEGLRIHDKYGRKDLYIEDWIVLGSKICFDYDHKAPCDAELTVEDLLKLEREIVLTPTAIKQIGL